MKKNIKHAFIKSLPVMAGYIVLGIGFGILLKKAGYGFKMVMYKNVCSPPSAKEPKSQLNAEQPSKGRCWNPPKEAPYV